MTTEASYPDMRNALKGLLAGNRFEAGSHAERTARTVVDHGLAALDDAGKATFKSMVLPVLNEADGFAAKVRETVDDVSEAAADAAVIVEEKLTTLRTVLTDEVRHRPYQALALAAGLGFMAALLATR